MKNIIIWLMAVMVIISISFLGIGCKGEPTTAEAEAAGPKPIKIGLTTTYGTNPSVAIILDAVKAEVDDPKWADIFDIELIIVDAGDVDPGSSLVAAMEDLYAQGVDGLLLFPAGGSEECSIPLKELYNKNNVPVALLGVGIASGDYVVLPLSDNHGGGAMAAEYAATFFDKDSKVQAWNGTPGSTDTIQRCAGYEDKMNELGMNVLPQKGTSVSLEQSQKDMEDLLTSDPDIKGVFSTNYIMAVGAFKALENANLVGEVQLTPFDIDGHIWDEIKAGNICAAVLQDLTGWGTTGANALLKTLNGETVEQKDIILQPQLVTVENYQDFVDNPQVNIR